MSDCPVEGAGWCPDDHARQGCQAPPGFVQRGHLQSQPCESNESVIQSLDQSLRFGPAIRTGPGCEEMYRLRTQQRYRLVGEHLKSKKIVARRLLLLCGDAIVWRLSCRPATYSIRVLNSTSCYKWRFIISFNPRLLLEESPTPAVTFVCYICTYILRS